MMGGSTATRGASLGARVDPIKVVRRDDSSVLAGSRGRISASAWSASAACWRDRPSLTPGAVRTCLARSWPACATSCSPV